MSQKIPKAPDFLDRLGKKEWRQLVDVLDRVPDLMREPDWYLAGILADALSTYKQMSAVLRGKQTSDLKQHQVVRLRIEAKNTILECLRQLGMTPQARRQMHGPAQPAKAENPLGEYIFKLQSGLD